MSTHHFTKTSYRVGLAMALWGLTSACTGQLPDSFRLQAQTETFASTTEVNTKVDMLWVIDSSGSMDVSQQNIRAGFQDFATKYMKPTWDIRVAAIPTDTYLANVAFNNWRNSYQVSTSSTFRSDYLRGITAGGIPGRTAPTLAALTSLFDLNPASGNYGKALSGIKNIQARPAYSTNWAKLQAGLHDGPMPILCYERETSFIDPSNLSKCYIRDDQTANTGVEHCVNPTGGETASSQCVNTLANNSVRSGKAIIETIPPTGTAADQAWTDQLYKDFIVNLSVGTVGQGSERPLASMKQLVEDNEGAGSPTAFFRPNSLRVIVFVTDENDQSMTYPASPNSSFGPNTDYTGSCNHVIDGVTFSVPNCPVTAKLVAPADYKTYMDNFFHTLDGTASSESANYLVVSIVASTAQSVQDLRTARGSNELDRADRVIEFGNLVGNGSLIQEISSPNYSAMFDEIGATIVAKKSSFTLARAPNSDEDLILTIVHQDGTGEVIPPSAYTVSGKTVTITDQAVVLGLKSTDSISVTYNPKSVN